MTMLFYNHGYSFFCIILFFALVSCSTNSTSPELNTDGTFSQAGLDGITINRFNQFEGAVYAGSNRGLYRRAKGTTSWSPLGLQEEKVLDVVFLPGDKLLAAIRISDFSKSIPSLFLSVDDGQSWQPYLNNYGGETSEYTWVEALASLEKSSDTLFARNSGTTIVRSINGGENWDLVNGAWDSFGGAAVLIYTDPYFSERIWAGGVNAFSQPYLLKSLDNGITWEDQNILENVEAVCWDLAVHPQKSSTILAGLSGAITEALQIRKSTNGGQSWTSVYEGIGTRTLTNSARNPQVVYASGRTPSGTLFFAASADFGDTWEMIEMKNGPAGMRVNDMVSVIENGKEVLYLGTNQGVYSYRFEE